MALSGTVEHATAFSLTGSPPDGANAWDGTAAHTVTLSGIASAVQGGTGIAYFTVAGPTVERVYTFPDAAATILYSGGALGTPSSGVLTNATGLPVAGLANGTDGELITWDAAGVAATVAVGTATHVLTSNGVGVAPTFQAVPASASTLDGIAAAAADQAGIANADWNIRWNWAKVTNSEVAFELGESAAATGGTSTSGIPNQVLLKLSTLAASTMSPLSVFVRGAHAFSISPTTGGILATGSAGVLAYSWAASTTTGLTTYTAGLPGIAIGVILNAAGGALLQSAAGGVAAPMYSVISDFTTGFVLTTALIQNVISAVENSRFAAGIFQASKGTADTTAYAINSRKSRGTVASPTVITTGDDLLTISGFGYVGATNTYQEAAMITFDSTGTIADTTTGIGGIVRILAAKVGAEVAEIIRFTAGTTTGGGWATLNEADASPAAGDLADGDEAAVYVKAGNIVFAQNVAGTINFLYCPLDGTTTLWTADTTGP